MPTRSVCLVTVSIFEQEPGRSGRQQPSIEFYLTIPFDTIVATVVTVHALSTFCIELIVAERCLL